MATRTKKKPIAGAGSTDRALVIGNWKMQLDVRASRELAYGLKKLSLPRSLEVAVCPSHLALVPVAEIIEGTVLQLGAQDVSVEDRGAYTGEVSAQDLKKVGCRYVIVGHSERRRLQHETDEDVARKLFAAMSRGLTPVLCVGESNEDRHRHRQYHVVEQQLRRALRHLPPRTHGQGLVIAYEPVWAISPHDPAEPRDALEMAEIIRAILDDHLGSRAAGRSVKVLYGGSVGPDNVRSFIDGALINGVLVGSASISAATFGALCKAIS